MNSEKPADISLIDGTNRRGTGQGDRTMTSKTCSTSRIWMILAITFLLTSIALAAFFIYTKAFDTEESDQDKKVAQKYPGYFRTVPQQESYALQYQLQVSEENATEVPEQNRTKSDYCTFMCQGNGNPARKKRFAPLRSPFVEMVTLYMTAHKLEKRSTTPLGAPVFHGCCISRHSFVSPDTAINAQGQTVTVVQLQDQRQYFPTQQCKHAQGCQGCRCAQETTLLTAVISTNNPGDDDDDDDTTTLALIRIPGCCKCFNN